MKSKKFWAAMLAGMMAVGSLTGCGGSSSGGWGMGIHFLREV